MVVRALSFFFSSSAAYASVFLSIPPILTKTKRIHSSLSGFELTAHVLEIRTREQYY